ncbi:MAG: exopolysaccharide Pel transporter PelG [Rhodospirillaceae bacterium]|jgi:polysaccharide biosynthesis protein PelG|nr:exopolysaccharide Pel transporter PelG [Rhodospirillaceae bacterium]
MAGIGFVLRKLTRRDDLLGIVQGYTHAALASTGPWLFTVLSLGAISFLTAGAGQLEEVNVFRTVIIYNFGFSLVFTGPILLVATRYLSDMIYRKDVSGTVGMLLGSMVLAFGSQAFIVLPFYLLYVDLPPVLLLASIVNYFVIAGIWLVAIYLTALKDFNAITRSFAAGMLAGAVGAVWLAFDLGALGMMIGFTGGLALIFFALIARIFAEYPYRFRRPFAFLAYYRTYWELAASGFVYNLAIWADKWLMWTAPERDISPSGLVTYPDYDSAMFLAYLTVVPSLAAFVLQVETSFFERYLAFYRDIQHHANFRRIARNQREIVVTILHSGRNLLILQGCITFVVIAMAPNLFAVLGLNFRQIGMFRIGVLGSFFQVLVLSLSVIVAYFDLRKVTLAIFLVMLMTNIGFTLITLELGFPYYGYGNFFSNLVTFLFAAFAAAHYLNQLPYLTFVRNNASVQG